MSRWGDGRDKVHFWNGMRDLVLNGKIGWVTLRLEAAADMEERLGRGRVWRKMKPRGVAAEGSRRHWKDDDGKEDREDEDGDRDGDRDDDSWHFAHDWSQEPGGGNVVRVYCFGGATKPVWANLYTFCFKRVQGLVWIDAAGKEVLRF